MRRPQAAPRGVRSRAQQERREEEGCDLAMLEAWRGLVGGDP